MSLARYLTLPRTPGTYLPTHGSECVLTFPRRIMSATIRDNILFSHKYEEEFYNLVLDGVSTLTSRPDSLADEGTYSVCFAPGPRVAAEWRHDGSWREGYHCKASSAIRSECQADSRHPKLSGGQRARVALARAVYARADLWVMS